MSSLPSSLPYSSTDPTASTAAMSSLSISSLSGAPPASLLDRNVVQVVILVDPYSTGCLIGQEMKKRGYQIIALWTLGFASEMKLHIPQSCGPMNYLMEFDQTSPSVSETGSMIQNFLVQQQSKSHQLVACLAGGEAGVDLADALSEHLGLLTNGTQIPNRRDKKIQQELIRKVGLRSVRQAGGSNFSDVEDFLKTEPYPIVLKPIESAGSDGVKLCNTFQEAKDHFHLLMQSQMVNGGAVPAVVCQEFLRGKEYVVDHVSLNGIHKTMMVWVYDKRPANGSAFVYFGCVPIDTNSSEAKILIPYVRAVLGALGVQNGPSHGEVIMTEEGPCLVEMNCRAHGGDGNWRPLCRALTGGYSQVEATAMAYLDEKEFHRLPDKPCSPFKASGQEVILVSFSKGTVKSTPGYEVMKNVPSFVCLETSIIPGSQVDYTVDLFTGIGSIILMHRDPDILQHDIDFIRYMEKINGLFIYETKLANLNRPRGDAVVLTTVSGAPYESGAGNTSSSSLMDKDGKQHHHLHPPLHRRVFSSESPQLIRHISNDRPDLRGPLMKRMTTVDASKEVVVMINPYSTGCCIVEEILKRGYRVIKIWTQGFADAMKTHVPLSVGELHYLAEVNQLDDLTETVNALYKAAGQYRVVAVMAGGEAGVDFADVLSERLKLRTNGTHIPNRRNKKMQQELIKKCGLRSIRQAGSDTFSEVESFLQREPYPLVLKPVESAGSDGVKLCHNFEESKEHFDVLMHSQMVNGGQCPAVLCQEFLRGKEYVVDHVSRDGVHKTVMVWVYDKRPANGNAFVYFGCVPIDSSSPEAKILIPYVRRVLDALEIRNGPTHAEVMMTNDGPCLVEMNCRANGGDGSWIPLCRALTGGYTQVDCAVDSFLDQRQFMITPDIPPSPFKAHGQEVILVSFSRGIVKSTPGFEEIKKLASYLYLETGVRPGSFVDYTIDLFTGIGSVILVHDDETILAHDRDYIRTMEQENRLFEYETNNVMLRSASSHHVTNVVMAAADRPDIL